MSKFLTELDARLKDDDKVWIMDDPLVYESDIIGAVTVPKGFETDFASVPRLPVIYTLFGDRAHRESVIHDYLYRIESIPEATKEQADLVFLEAMECRGKSWFIRKCMYWGVCVGSASYYHKKKVGDTL
jgi:hypothetical protein